MSKIANVKMTNELKNPTEPGSHHRLVCMTGPNKGKVYYLIGKRVIIGRGETADIQIADTKISREHAELSFANNGYTITDLGAQNGIIVNDTKIKQKKLEEGEKIVIGQTVFKYNIFEIAAHAVVAIEDTKIVNSGRDQATKISKPKSISAKASNSFSSGGDSFSTSRNSSSTSSGGSQRMLIMGAVVVVVLFVLFDKGDKPRSKTSNAASPEGKEFTDTFVDNSPKKMNKEDAEINKKLNNLVHSGRREFSEGNYFRAMEDFRLALLLSPNNGHASFYLSKAKQRLDEDIEKNFLKGKQEYEAKKLQASIVSYCSVAQLIQNYPDDERYKNAMLKISAIESELGLEKGEIKCFEAKSADQKN